MLKKFVFTAVWLAPVAAVAGGGESYSDGSFLLQVVTRLVGKLAGLF